MKAAILIGMLVFLLAGTVAGEIDYSYRCSGDVLVKEANFTIGSDVYELNQTVKCPYGCDANVRACIPAPVQGYIWAGVFILILFIIAGAIFKYG